MLLCLCRYLYLVPVLDCTWFRSTGVQWRSCFLFTSLMQQGWLKCFTQSFFRMVWKQQQHSIQLYLHSFFYDQCCLQALYRKPRKNSHLTVRKATKCSICTWLRSERAHAHSNYCGMRNMFRTLTILLYSSCTGTYILDECVVTGFPAQSGIMATLWPEQNPLRVLNEEIKINPMN